MPYLDNEAVEKAKSVDLLTYLREHEPRNLVKLSKNNYCTREHDSLKISNGKWYWFSRGFGGYTALDYLTKVKEIPFANAIEILAGTSAVLESPSKYTEKEVTKKLLIPELSDSTDRAKRYLMNRGIHPDVIDYGVRNSLIFETAKYHNVVFVGYDPDGIARYAAMRSTQTAYKGDLTGSDKRFSFSFCKGESTHLHLFEAAIDLLSYVSLLQMYGIEWQEEAYLSLGGVYQMKRKEALPQALSQYLSDHPEVKTIYLHLDNDEVGRGATEGIMAALKDKYRVIDDPPAFGKDVNDTLQEVLKREGKEKEHAVYRGR